jgi:hypothetical protein
MRGTEAASHRVSGHRIENAPLSEYQTFPAVMPSTVIDQNGKTNLARD